MNFSLPAGTLTLIPASGLDKIKRYQECIANFACEISGRDADRCISAISPMEHELESRADGSYRVHKPTEPQARLIQQQVQNWVASSPESREVDAFPVSTDHSAQQAKDASNPQLCGSSAGSFSSGLALTGGPWSVKVEVGEDGQIASVLLQGAGAAAAPAKTTPKPPAAEAKPQEEEVQPEIAAPKEELEDAKTPPKTRQRAPSPKKRASPRKRPAKK